MAGYYGDYNCDTNLPLLLKTIESVAALSPDYVFLTGDDAPHNVWRLVLGPYWFRNFRLAIFKCSTPRLRLYHDHPYFASFFSPCSQSQEFNTGVSINVSLHFGQAMPNTQMFPALGACIYTKLGEMPPRQFQPPLICLSRNQITRRQSSGLPRQSVPPKCVSGQGLAV